MAYARSGLMSRCAVKLNEHPLQLIAGALTVNEGWTCRAGGEENFCAAR
jgi:hypothetical protein